MLGDISATDEIYIVCGYLVQKGRYSAFSFTCSGFCLPSVYSTTLSLLTY